MNEITVKRQVKFNKNKLKLNKNSVKLDLTKPIKEKCGMSSFGEWLKSQREAAGFNQTELAELSRVSKTTISYLESNKIEQPRKKQIEKIAKALNLPVEEVQRRSANISNSVGYIPPKISAIGFDWASDEDIELIVEHIEFLKYRRKKKKGVNEILGENPIFQGEIEQPKRMSDEKYEELFGKNSKKATD